MTVWWGKRGASLFSEGGQIRVEVAPARVHCLYKLALTAAGAGLDLLFPQDGALHRSVQLVPHQPPAIVASAKTFLQIFAVLIGPPQEVGSDTSVERPVGAARHDVDGGEFILSHRCLLYQRAGRGVGGRRGIWNEWHLRMDRHCRCATSRGRWGVAAARGNEGDSAPYAASWKMMPRVRRSPLRRRLTPWRRVAR